MRTTFLTQKSARSDATNEDVVSLRGKRFILLSETEPDEVINISSMKGYTGDGSITYRGLYDSIKTTNVMCSLWMATNEKQSFPVGERAILRRVVHIYMRALFCDPTDKERDYVDSDRKCFDIDIKLMKNLIEYRDTFMYLLLQNLDPDWKIEFPKFVIDETEEMIRSQDTLQGICESLFEPDPAYGISWVDMNKLMNKDCMFTAIKKRYKTLSTLKEQVAKRIPYAKKMVNSNCRPFVCNFKLENGSIEYGIQNMSSKWFFQGIKARQDDIIPDETCLV
jgi:phage/plasmid-associated DNA primase